MARLIAHSQGLELEQDCAEDVVVVVDKSRGPVQVIAANCVVERVADSSEQPGPAAEVSSIKSLWKKPALGAWNECASVEYRFDCRLLDSMGIVISEPCGCGSGASDSLPAFHRLDIAIKLDCQEIRQTSRDRIGLLELVPVMEVLAVKEGDW
ncbi:hypothetical protein QAD02_008866 [Eretmocerus hayati]|uniref:Uncharacterized protein n=1 Tax=Eretmocerus hayati TaxID=131215 RepID=A0ACC2NA43_9HYME|nr:hypothetical protein QAD02_008866 [Eretmocerus hayati]